MIITDHTWKQYGACYDTDHNFFDLREPRKSETKRVCDSCNVQEECLEYALVSNQEFGMWGGTTPDERIKLRKKHPKIVAQRKARIAAGKKPMGNPKHYQAAK